MLMNGKNLAVPAVLAAADVSATEDGTDDKGGEKIPLLSWTLSEKTETGKDDKGNLASRN